MIRKTRAESFGGLIFNEKPGFVAYVNQTSARILGIKKNDSIILPEDIFCFPMDAHFAVTTRCNLFCKGCYNTTSADEKCDIDFNRAKKIIDNLSSLNVFSVSFGGGEPTLYPYIIELAEYTRAKRILPNITTNGVNMTDELSRKMKVFGNVHLSLHTMEDMAHIENAVKLLKSHGVSHIGLNLLLSSETICNIERIFCWAKGLRFDKVLCLRYKFTDKNRSITEMSIDSEYRNAFESIMRFGNKYRLKLLADCSALQEYIGYSKMSEKLLYYFDTNGCQGANAYIAITVDGKVKPCSFWHEAFFDAETMTQDDWLNNEKIVAFRNSRKTPRCNECEHFKLCGGGCRLPGISCCKSE